MKTRALLAIMTLNTRVGDNHHREDQSIAGNHHHEDQSNAGKHGEFIIEDGCPNGVVKTMASLNREATKHAQWQLTDA